MRHMAAELIREKVLAQTYDELPYAVGVLIEEFQEEPGLTTVRAVILVEKTSQKGIVIGKKGMRLKEIGQSARLDMERLFGMKIYLRMWVKVQEGWRDNVQVLNELGYG